MRKGLQNLQTEEEKANSQYRILAVDDEEGIIDSLSIFLKRSGYNFTGVTDPLEAIEKVKTEHFDMLILDFMPLCKPHTALLPNCGTNAETRF